MRIEELEKCLLQIFEDKIKASENQKRFHEKVLKKSKNLEGEERVFLEIKLRLKAIPFKKNN